MEFGFLWARFFGRFVIFTPEKLRFMATKTRKPKPRIPIAPPSKRHKTIKDYKRKPKTTKVDDDFENWAKIWKDYP